MIYDIPRRTKESIDAYAEEGRPPGGFVRACLENDLAVAIGRADDTNRRAITEIVQYIYNEIPKACWGSPEAVQLWIARHDDSRDLTQEEVDRLVEGRR